MKIGIFTDPHYSSREISCGVRYNSRSLEKIKDAFCFFQKEQCSLVICLGDLIDREETHCKEIDNLKEIAKVIKRYGIPTVCVMGNHDAVLFTVEEFYEILGNCMPVNRRIEEKNFIFLDACYYKNGNHYMPRGSKDWTDTCLSKKEMNSLEIELSKKDMDAYIFMHQNIDPSIPENHRLANADEIRLLVENSGVVKTVFQGHYHPGNKTVLNGVEYLTLPAMCENENAYCSINI